ncbi:MAG: hypothetical protein GPOALKHO_000910 [Sodalis sp.]|uniref:DUF481 domain-containing protein n=1 Tax=Sodalis sp. (in: enterobacteria) TaxID=1898979 RepID=UPI00387321E5|nr:MAG: hypothetical protein GPOALKHO_000910 [Sodalis sp.]
MYPDEYQGGSNFTKALSYAPVSCSYQLTDNTKFVQGLSLLSNDDTTVSPKTELNIDINDHFY